MSNQRAGIQQAPRWHSFVALGDSFTEGIGDQWPDGTPRGWSDLVAAELAGSVPASPGHTFRYANLAVRGKLLGQIVDEQVEPALQMKAELVTLAGGGNDLLRPRCDIPALLRLMDQVVARFVDAGTVVVMFTGADPSAHLPMGRLVRRHGDRFCLGVREIAERRGCRLVDLWSETELSGRQYWDADRLHLNEFGHRAVAARTLACLGMSAPDGWMAGVPAIDQSDLGLRGELAYYGSYVLPWIRRRITGTSSGDGVLAKRPQLMAIEPSS